MKLQVALDVITIAEAIELLGKISEEVDVVEVGTPFIVQEGLKAVREIHAAFPKLEVLADLKIMDAGEHETQIAMDAGASVVTVLGVSDDVTIRAAIDCAHKNGGKVLVDLIAVKDLAARAAQVDEMGADYICVHTATDMQAVGKNPLADLALVKGVVKHSGVAVAGGISRETIAAVAAQGPDVVIVGSAITGQADPLAAVQALRAAMQ